MSKPLRFSEHSQTEVTGVLDALGAPAVALTPDYRILAANQAYRDTYGDGKPLHDRHCYEVSHHYVVPCDQAGESCPLADCLASGRKQRVLHLHHTPRGEEHVDVETHPVRNDDGEISYVIEIMRETRTASSRAEAHGMVGRSRAFNRMLELVNRVAPAETAALLQGESGTGKELVARAIHDNSPRSDRPFVVVECSGLTESLFESELFGHERGAFTGAHAKKIGLVEAAEGGTLFLDEVGDVPLSLQVKLLRLLESGTYRRVGSVVPRKADFRLVTATHRDLQAMVDAGSFRRDLFYRISTFPIALPALKDRAEDLPLLIESLLSRLSPGQVYTVSPAALACLQRYRFPGNIRELRNILERAMLLTDDEEILPAHLPAEACDADDRHRQLPAGDEILPLKELERRYLIQVLARFPGDRDSLAEKLGISKRTLFRKLQELKAG
ncbi:MAG TPA: sigma-54-dependent Fis family transcriptional regulator [Gammaproteobacteria bacterium]|nr:sigma-54-dependent Fis family transcriptional regulator [Gammaproteobacteria bacterium]